MPIGVITPVRFYVVLAWKCFCLLSAQYVSFHLESNIFTLEFGGDNFAFLSMSFFSIISALGLSTMSLAFPLIF